ncbi:MAG TPA: glyoxalase/bleomycin resistance/dioxygenase family protein [Porticoccaceae bacterium]|jgi:catechol 2,3-dioxygenase-like lactoylglutathione lyase family enzyme|nr:glyoxalase/bleomycin resistance/dioxygenase family protein [Gammaproteobacteria bacterium]HIL61491.1 glyoxalase/bleomycin resistance/dioxygenase family protein [Porticoccaceae bacterium]
MKRLHVHVTVDDIEKGISFYSTLFAQEASVVKNDYAKWMLEDPAVNFAISEKHGKVGLNHLGFQVDSDAELKEIEDRLREAELTGHKEDNKNCCYAKANKYWTMDPAKIPWENFRTLDSIPTFGDRGEVPL